jgi:long-chain acyl-CoA synthetase
MFSNIDEFGKEHKLNSLERVKKIYLEPVSLVELDACTSTFKIKRHDAKKIFASQIDAMYK